MGHAGVNPATAITFDEYRPEMDGAVVAFWNNVFADTHNFFPFSLRDWRERVVGRDNPLEPFLARNLVLARDRGRVVGMVHCGRRSEEFCRAAFGDAWAGGEQAYVALLAVLLSHRRQGVGTRLLEMARERVAPGAAAFVLDGQCVNPFYGNSEAPFTVPFGTTEGVSLLWSDEGSRAFFARHGFQPRHRAVSYARELTGAPEDPDCAVKDLEGKEYKVLHCRNYAPEVGKSIDDWKTFVPGHTFDTIAALQNDTVVSTLIGYRMLDLDPAKWAIYEFQTDPRFERLGYGRAVLSFWLNVVRKMGASRVEVLTLPDVSPGAVKLYERFHFTPVAEWAVY